MFCTPFLKKYIFIYLFIFKNFIFTLQYCIGFAIYWHESTMGVYKLPILNPPPTSHPISSLWIILMHQPPSILYPVSNIDWHFISYMIVYMFQCHSPKSSHPLPLPESKSPFYTSVSLLLSRIQGHHYHLSTIFHIYVSVYCIGVFFLAYFTLYNWLQFHPSH